MTEAMRIMETPSATLTCDTLSDCKQARQRKAGSEAGKRFQPNTHQVGEGLHGIVGNRHERNPRREVAVLGIREGTLSRNQHGQAAAPVY